jgi:hypothetical protein
MSCASDHDDINLECNEFGHESGEPLERVPVTSVFDHDVAALDVTEITQSLAEALALAGASRQVAYSRDLIRLLRPGDERRSEDTGQRGQQEAAAVRAVGHGTKVQWAARAPARIRSDPKAARTAVTVDRSAGSVAIRVGLKAWLAAEVRGAGQGTGMRPAALRRAMIGAAAAERAA